MPLRRIARAAGAPLYCLFQWRGLIRRLTINELQSRYRTTFLGLFWFVLTPLLYLTAFSLVFGYILPGRSAAWGHLGGGELGFVLGLFSGLIMFWMFSEVVLQSANLLPKNRNLVSEMRFPTEVLPWVAACCALCALIPHLLLFILLHMLWFEAVPWTLIALPILLLPYILILTGLAWVVAAASVIVRDIAPFLQVATTGMLFLSGVFYPADRIPEGYRAYFLLNPVAHTIEDVRSLVFEHRMPSLESYLIYLFAGITAAILGYAFFKHLQPRFADNL